MTRYPTKAAESGLEIVGGTDGNEANITNRVKVGVRFPCTVA